MLTTILFCLIVVVLLVVVIDSWRTHEKNTKLKDQVTALEQHRDNLLLDKERLKTVGREVYPYLGPTDESWFYGEDGKQADFAQRQQIAGRVQDRNTAIRRFEGVFDITHTDKARAATGQPQMSGRGALDIMGKFQAGKD